MILIFVSDSLGGCYMERGKKGAVEQRLQFYCGSLHPLEVMMIHCL